MLEEILEILNEIDTNIEYEFLNIFINTIGNNNLSDDIKTIFDSSMERPSAPIENLEHGTYIKPISIKLDIDKSTIIKLIEYNKKEKQQK